MEIGFIDIWEFNELTWWIRLWGMKERAETNNKRFRVYDLDYVVNT